MALFQLLWNAFLCPLPEHRWLGSAFLHFLSAHLKLFLRNVGFGFFQYAPACRFRSPAGMAPGEEAGPVYRRISRCGRSRGAATPNRERGRDSHDYGRSLHMQVIGISVDGY